MNWWLCQFFVICRGEWGNIDLLREKYDIIVGRVLINSKFIDSNASVVQLFKLTKKKFWCTYENRVESISRVISTIYHLQEENQSLHTLSLHFFKDVEFYLILCDQKSITCIKPYKAFDNLKNSYTN